jgi:DnaJ-class molecular chaperone
MELEVTQVCPKCNGSKVYETSSDSGAVVIDPCPTCLGEGKIELLAIDAKAIKKRFDDVDKDLKDIKDHLGI